MRHWGGALELEVQHGGGDPRTVPSAAGSVLADYLSDPEWNDGTALTLADRFVVELGSGIGSCAITAALCGAIVVATDTTPPALQLLRDNGTRYAGHCAYGIRVEPLVWGDADHVATVCQGRYPDIVLAADLLNPDIISSDADLQYLKNTLEMITGPETWIVWAHEWRDHPLEQQLLLGLFQAFEGPYEMNIATAPTDNKPVSIYMYRKR